MTDPIVAVLAVSQLGLAAWLFLVSRRLHNMTTLESLEAAVAVVQQNAKSANDAVLALPGQLRDLLASLPTGGTQDPTLVGTVPDAQVLAAAQAVVDATRSLTGSVELVQSFFDNVKAGKDPTNGVA